MDEPLEFPPPVELYEVLRPVYLRTAQFAPWSTQQNPAPYWRVHWLVSGTARTMDEAKQRFGGSPVLRPLI